jgi:hypothetical protein
MSENSPTSDFDTGHMNVGRSAVRQLNATNVDVQQSAIQRVAAGSVRATNSALGMANAATVEVKESAIGVAAGDYVRVEESKVFILLAPRVSGNVEATITLPAAVAFGAGYFIARRIFSALFPRRDG